jgi:hypothetical protein
MKEQLKRIRLTNKAFITLIVASLGTILVSISADAGTGDMAFDRAGNLFLAESLSDRI